jgi:sulfhydrogenase subunit delta
MAHAAARKPRLAVWKFASCDGCQLGVLDLEDDLLSLADAVEIANFTEASSTVLPGPYDVSLVEGSITTAHDAERIKKVRTASRVLVTIGACATAGGVQALRNLRDVGEMAGLVYAHPEWVSALADSTPIADHVAVDYELRGCPVNKLQLLELVGALLHGRAPNLPRHSVCVECKRRGTACVMVERGIPCMGPVTAAGCGAICPAYARGCYGCFGPAEAANTAALAAWWTQLGVPRRELARAFRGINGAAEPFATEAARHGG